MIPAPAAGVLWVCEDRRHDLPTASRPLSPGEARHASPTRYQSTLRGVLGCRGPSGGRQSFGVLERLDKREQGLGLGNASPVRC